eukprot:4628777-Prorocentrum_lima.AAC.1
MTSTTSSTFARDPSRTTSPVDGFLLSNVINGYSVFSGPTGLGPTNRRAYLYTPRLQTNVPANNFTQL